MKYPFITSKEKKRQKAFYDVISDRYKINRNYLVYKNSNGTFVHRGIDAETREIVVIKTFTYEEYEKSVKKRDRKPFEYHVEKFRSEYELSKLSSNHPHILKTLDYVYEEEKKRVHLISEYIPGTITLSDYIRYHASKIVPSNKYKYKERLGREFTRQLVSAVGFLHAHKIAHCDLKPGNIIICPFEAPPEINHDPTTTKAGDIGDTDEKGDYKSSSILSKMFKKRNHPIDPKRVIRKSPLDQDWTAPCIKLLDFGLCAPANGDKESFHEGYFGTEFFLSPEIIKEESRGGLAPDIWAIGVIAQMLVTGLQPFTIGGRGYRPNGFHATYVKLGDHLRLRWFSYDYEHFCKRVFNVIWERRALITEVADHPWLNCGRRKAGYHEHPFPIQDRNLPPRAFKMHRIYSPISFYLPDYKAMLNNEDVLDVESNRDIVEVVCSKAMGWNGHLDTKELDVSTSIEKIRCTLQQMRQEKPERIRFRNAETGLYMLILAQKELAVADAKRRLSANTMVTIDDKKQPA